LEERPTGNDHFMTLLKREYRGVLAEGGVKNAAAQSNESIVTTPSSCMPLDKEFGIPGNELFNAFPPPTFFLGGAFDQAK